MTEDILTNVQVSPRIHVVIGRGTDARTEDLTFADIAQADDDPATISDARLKELVERHFDPPLEPGALKESTVQRPGTGNIIIGPEAVFGQ